MVDQQSDTQDFVLLKFNNLKNQIVVLGPKTWN